MTVQTGDKIKVEYEGRFENGKIFDSSAFHGKPLEFTAGSGMVVLGFDHAVMGMDVGQEKEVKLLPKEAYGESDPRAIQNIPRAMLPKEVLEGMEIGVPLPNGQTYPAVITKITEKGVTIDLNHPMAGKTLIFKIKVVEIEK
jgi:FKBP-type peptidyl-prolyl cis-trans isomerase 2